MHKYRSKCLHAFAIVYHCKTPIKLQLAVYGWIFVFKKIERTFRIEQQKHYFEPALDSRPFLSLSLILFLFSGFV